MSTAIKVENLSKKYMVSHQQRESYTTLRDVLGKKVKIIGHKLTRPFNSPPVNDPTQEEFWALRDVGFSINKGDRVGIIGRNGAGKSTLLKILSRITEPTVGKLSIVGRIASLLEVGTGFHPELTGRENIYLNGAILGMSRKEIKSKFDEIVAFAEIERFLDTPVKRYSSGMYVRLAFSVAAHLEPDILIVDEVLAVGDSQFQKKCLGKLDQAGSEGRTVLFVSHNMSAIQHLCKSGIYLDHGRIRHMGPVDEVIEAYINSEEMLSGRTEIFDRKDRKGNGNILFRRISLAKSDGAEVGSFRCGEPAVFKLHLSNAMQCHLDKVIIGFGINNSLGTRVATMSSDISGQSLMVAPGDSVVALRLSELPLVPGQYSYTLFISINGEIADWLQNAGTFSVEGTDFYGTGRMRLGQGDLLLRYEYASGRTP